MVWMAVSFFCQAEDGIRDRSPSRGLGDVYKRQIKNCTFYSNTTLFITSEVLSDAIKVALTRTIEDLKEQLIELGVEVD